MADDITSFLVKRDGEGNVEPYEVKVTGIREENEPLLIKILPTTVGSLKGLTDPNADVIKWSIEDKIEYVRRHVVEPDFGALTAEELEERMTMWDLDMILISAVQHGGPMRQKRGDGKKGPTGGGRSKRRSPHSKRTSTT
ncbi:hypothetical protein LCGC14_0251060 [marine sediment metagenome]|uniref:Tail assembly chaperone n=1 Tax=marine sediment metagenome TaxID=412755 RepID=A0A0F9U8V7_9ZZZZ